MASYIGIDLGTTFSAIAKLDKTGRPIIIDNPDKTQAPNKNITSSCVKLEEKQFVVGEVARKAFQTGDKSAIGRFKKEMHSNKKIGVGDESFSPTELSAAILKELKKITVNDVGEIAEIVITVPANFSHEARSNTIKAAKLAGIDVKHIIDEPTAAALILRRGT